MWAKPRAAPPPKAKPILSGVLGATWTDGGVWDEGAVMGAVVHPARASASKSAGQPHKPDWIADDNFNSGLACGKFLCLGLGTAFFLG